MITESDSQKPPRELSIEEVLTRTFELYSRKFAMFLILGLIASLTTGILSIPLRNYVEAAMVDFEPSASPEVVLEWVNMYLPTLLCVTAVVIIISLIVNAIAHGICSRLVSDMIEKGDASLEEAFQFTVCKLFSLLVVVIITGILTALGFIAIVVPGIVLTLMFCLVVQVVIIEDVALDSLSRSRRLVSNRWLKTFVLLLIVCAIVLFVSFVGSLIGSPFGAAGSVVSSIIAAFVQPVLPISLTVYYYSMLAKEEQLRVPPPPPPPF
jgi:hypothetical protein